MGQGQVSCPSSTLISLPGPTSPPATAWNRSHRRNPPRASWSLSPARGCRTQRLGLGNPGVNSHCCGGGVLGRWAAEGGAAEGPGPAQQGWGLPSPPRSQQQPWLHGPLAPGLPHGGGWRQLGTPAHGRQGEGPRRRLRRLWAPCVRVRAHCSTGRLHATSGGAGGGGGVKGASEPTGLSRDPGGAAGDRQGDTHTLERTCHLCGHTQRQRHTPRHSTYSDTQTL